MSAAGVLLDTHALVWWLFDDPRLSATARRWIAETDAVYVSAASIYEIDAKRRRIERQAARGLTRTPTGVSDPLLRMPANMPGSLPMFGMQLLDITPEVAWRAARLPFDHADPWDRILVAQARILNIPLVSCDRHLLDQARDTPIIW